MAVALYHMCVLAVQQLVTSRSSEMMSWGRGEFAYVVIRGCAISLGTFLGVLPNFWVPFWAIPRFWVPFWGCSRIFGYLSGLFPDFGYLFVLFPDFWISFFGKNLISLGIIQIFGY